MFFTFSLSSWAVYNKNVEKVLKKRYKEVTYIVHSDCYLVSSRQDKGYNGVCNSNGDEVVAPVYKKISFEKAENNEILIFALNPNHKSDSPGNSIFSLKKGRLLNLGKSEPHYIIGGFITSYLNPIYDLDGNIVLDCQQTSVQPLRRGLKIIGYRVGTRTKVNNDWMNNVLVCDSKLNILFSLDGINYCWNIEEYPLSSTQYGWKCSKKIDYSKSLTYFYTSGGLLLSDSVPDKSTIEHSLQYGSMSGSLSQDNHNYSNYIQGSSNQLNIINNTTQFENKHIKLKSKSDVDEGIPVWNFNNLNTFALIIANENYQDVMQVENALNDGEIMAQYCQKTLGIPNSNIHLVKDATLNNIKREVNLMRQIADAYDGEASFIVYYAGHGIPDEKTNQAYLMPIDGFSSDLTTCYSISDFYNAFGDIPTQQTIIFIDACFSGSARGDEMLYAARGVKIKAKPGTPTGNTVVISSAQGDETAYPYSEQNHGLFTYFILKKLKESNGDITLGALFDYVKDNVRKKSLVANGKSQTPMVTSAREINDVWHDWKLK